MAGRDNFNAATKELLALRVGYRCSNPQCRTLTIGPSSTPDGTVSIGVAAHVCAAAPGGMRYDAAMSPEQRSGLSNGLWVCQNCSKIIDSDEKYTVAMLKEWRALSERAAVREIQTRHIPIAIESAPMLEDMAGNPLHLVAPAPATDPVARAHAASLADIAKLKLLDGWPAFAVSLGLEGRDGNESFKITDLGGTIRAARELAIVSQPGTGKTTTLVQAAESILTDPSETVGFVRLGNWATEGRGLVEAVAHRSSFDGVSEADLLKLAEENRFTLILDGWNELDQTSRARAASEVDRLRFDHPLLRIVVSTRRQATQLPISGLTFEVQPLSEEQQLDIARHTANGEELYDRAVRTPGVRDLLAIPLYLQALLANSIDGELPTTKEEVLRLFVDGHEKKRANADAFASVIQGNHQAILIALAVETTPTGNTSISEASARTVVSRVENDLIASGQMSISAPAPNLVLDTLVSHHVVVRGGDGSIGFQHQQLQEWHASFEVEAVMLLSATGDYDGNRRLVGILNATAWEEPVLFACERLSRASAVGQDAVAKAILETLRIDPMLAAGMIYRASAEVWNAVSDQVQKFVGNWHQANKIDRALRFAIITGRPEFAEIIWTFVASGDHNTYSEALMHAPRFRPSVLGPDRERRLSELPEKQREHVLGEIAHSSGMDGMELAAKLAIVDTSVAVKYSVIESLLFRRCDRLASQVLAAGPDALWDAVAEHRMAGYFTDQATNARLRGLQHELAKHGANKVRLLEKLAQQQAEDANASAEIEQAIFDLVIAPDFSIKDGHIHWALSQASERFPATVRRALIQRFENGLELPFQCEAMLVGGEPVDSGPIASLVFSPELHNPPAALAASLVGQFTALRMLDLMFSHFEDGMARGPEADTPRKALYWAVERRMDAVPSPALAKAWLAKAGLAEAKHYHFMADLWASHGSDPNRRDSLGLDVADRTAISDVLTGWADILIADKASPRSDLSEVATAIGRLALQRDIPLLERLLAEELHRRDEHHREFIKSGGNVDRHREARTVFGLQYRLAFANMRSRAAAEALRKFLTHPEMGKEAACGMKDIHDSPQVLKPELFRGHEISADEVNEHRKAISDGAAVMEAWEATAIFDAVEALTASGTDEVQHRLALSIACAANLMPHRRRPALNAKLLALPVPWSAKQGYLRTLAWSGELLSADSILAAIAELYERAKTLSYLIQHGHAYELREWLALLPFSDRPADTLKAIADLPKHAVDLHELESIIRPLGKIDHPDAEDILFALPQLDPNWIGRHEWVGAIIGRATESALIRLLELAETEPKALGGHGGFYHERQLQELMTAHPTLRKSLLARYKAGEFQRTNGVVERVLAQSADFETVLALIEAKAPKGATHVRELHGAVDAAVLEKRPVGTNSYEIHGVNATELRKALFGMLDGPCGALAKSCLVRIDKVRDEHGRVEFEPRHPDIDSKKPWPIVDDPAP